MKKMTRRLTTFGFIYLLLQVIGISIILSSCSNKMLGSKVKEPFAQDKFQSNKRFYRSVGKGESSDMSIAKSKARVAAKRNLAGNVKTTMRSMSDLYMGDTDNNIASDVKEKFESLSRELINQDIAQIAVIGQETFHKQGKFTSYQALEIKKKAMYKYFKKELKLKKKIHRETRKQMDFMLDQEIEKLEALEN